MYQLVVARCARRQSADVADASQARVKQFNCQIDTDFVSVTFSWTDHHLQGFAFEEVLENRWIERKVALHMRRNHRGHLCCCLSPHHCH